MSAQNLVFQTRTDQQAGGDAWPGKAVQESRPASCSGRLYKRATFTLANGTEMNELGDLLWEKSGEPG